LPIAYCFGARRMISKIENRAKGGEPHVA
jgi:hypothetical protein